MVRRWLHYVPGVRSSSGLPYIPGDVKWPSAASYPPSTQRIVPVM